MEYYKPCKELDLCNELIEKYWNTKEYDKCFEGHLPLAEQGYPLAECQIGYFYYDGLGVEKDLEKAFYWTRRAAEHGDRDGQCNLAWFYEDGIGVQQDLSLAKRWYKQAALQNHDLALEKCREYGIEITDVKLRNLTEADYNDMLVLCKALDELHVRARPDFFIHREDVYPKEHYEAAIHDPDCLLLGAFDQQNCMVGFVRATLWKESGMVKALKTVCLDNIYVLPEHRRCGVASRLFDAVENWARDQGAVRLELHTWEFNQSAIAMYRSKDMVPQRYVFEKKL